MKLYVWEDVLHDWGPGMMFAVAKSPEHARELLLKNGDWLPEDDLAKTTQEYNLTDPVAFYMWGGG